MRVIVVTTFCAGVSVGMLADERRPFFVSLLILGAILMAGIAVGASMRRV